MSGGLPARPGKTIVRAAEAAAWIDGYAMLERAGAQADALLAKTDATVAAARAEGFEAGRRLGEIEAVELLARTSAEVDRYLGGLDAGLAELALTLVRRLVGTFDDAALVAALAREALTELRRESRVTVRVAPALVSRVEALLAERGDAAMPAAAVEGDARLSSSRCIISSPVATLDVGLDAQLGAVRSAFAAGSGA